MKGMGVGFLGARTKPRGAPCREMSLWSGGNQHCQGRRVRICL